jgi:hypothetical protein
VGRRYGGSETPVAGGQGEWRVTFSNVQSHIILSAEAPIMSMAIKKFLSPL